MTDSIFTQTFDGYICDGDSITAKHDGFTFKAHIEHDTDHGAPWSEECGHGPVSDWTRRDKRAGELVLSQDSGSYRYYDYAQACKIAARDAWGVSPYNLEIERGANGLQRANAKYFDDDNNLITFLSDWCDDINSAIGQVYDAYRASVTPKQYAAKAAMQDYENLKAWCDDKWLYVGVIVTVAKNGITLCDNYKAALWGIAANYPKSDNSELLAYANELAPQALEIAQDALKALCDCQEVAA